MSRGDGHKVVAECKKLLKRHKRNFDVLHLMGIGYRIQERYDKALDFYLEALEVNPSGSATLFCNLAYACLESEAKSIFHAFDYAVKARELSPDIPEVYEVSADVALRIGDAQAAIAFLDKGLELRPQSTMLWVKKSRAQCPFRSARSGVGQRSECDAA